MRMLLVEDDFTSRLLLQRQLTPYGEVHIAANGEEAVAAFKSGLVADEPYELVCLDILLPGQDGQAVLAQFRELEADFGRSGLGRAKIIMTTALSDPRSIMKAFNSECEAYLVKPIEPERLNRQLVELGLIADAAE